MSGLAASGWHWRPAAQAVSPRAAVGCGVVAARLLGQLSRLPSPQRETLQVVAAPGWLVVLGPTDDLPWLDGVRYAAPSRRAPALWLPTHAEPDLAHDLVERALRRRHTRQPLLLWPDPAIALPLDDAQIAADAVLQRCAALTTP